MGGEAAVARSHQWQLGSSNKRMSLTDGKEGETQQIQPKSGANSQMERGREQQLQFGREIQPKSRFSN